MKFMPFVDPQSGAYYSTFHQAYDAFSSKLGLPRSPKGEAYYPTTVGEVEKAIDCMGFDYISFSPMRLIDILNEEKVHVRSIMTGIEFEYRVNPDEMRLEAEGKYIPLHNFYEQECLAVFPAS